MPDSTTQVIDREFSFSDRDFERVRKLIYAKAGISLNDGKARHGFCSRLSRRLRETGHQSFDSVSSVAGKQCRPQASQEWQEFTNCLTTNLTAFFREEHHFTPWPST